MIQLTDRFVKENSLVLSFSIIMTTTRKKNLLKVIQLIVLIGSIVTLASGQKSAASSKSEESSQALFRKHQKQLQELKKLAQDGGHPSPDEITKYDAGICYTRDCIEAGKIPKHINI